MSKIPLPKDHEGCEIPLDTLVLYDAIGGEMYVSSYHYQCDVLGLHSGWNVISEDTVGQCWQSPTDSLYLTPPDSLEKLADDLDRVADRQDGTACTYLDRDRRDCEGCEFEHRDCTCVEAFLRDVAARIRRLGGESK